MTASILNQIHSTTPSAAQWRNAIPEIDTMAASLADKHGADVMRIAALMLLSQSGLRQLGEAHGSNLEPLLALQRDCIHFWASERGISLDALTDALAGIERAGQTAHYLSTIPD